MKTIIVLDFSTCMVHTFKYDRRKYKSEDDFFDKNHLEYGFKQNQCEWMIVDNLEIEHH